MAYDRIITVRTRLDKCLNYAMNSAKNERHLCAAINCNAETAFADMEATKERWNRKGGVLGYHIVHSYKPGEVTAEQAQALGLEFARRLLGDKYEAVVSTHVDRNHLHCHIVFNSVSFVDGTKYLNTFKDYFGDIRGISNDVSRENGLSVIEPKAQGKHYAEWNAEMQGKPTIRGSIRRDIDAAIAGAISMSMFFSALEKQGYSIKRGPNIKHTAVRPPGGSRFIRLDSLGTDYTESAIKQRISEGAKAKPQIPQIPIRRHKLKSGNTKQRRKLKGFQALYVHYLYYLGIWKPRGKKRQLPFSVREDVKRLDQYRRQFKLLHHYRIETTEQLSMLQDALQAENNNSGVVDIISTQNYASQLNAVFEAMQYPLPSKEGQTAKKAKALAPQEISSSERGNGSRNMQSNEKPSVREKLEVMKEVAEKQKMPPVRSKDRAR